MHIHAFSSTFPALSKSSPSISKLFPYNFVSVLEPKSAERPTMRPLVRVASFLVFACQRCATGVIEPLIFC
jgi:hypothetical protein